MFRRLMAAAVVTSAAATMFAASPASALASNCIGDANSGSCFKLAASVSASKISVQQSVPLINASKYTATMHCSFTDTITKTITNGGSLSVEAKGKILGVVDVGTSVTVKRDVSQSAAAATTAGGSIVLKPGQSVTCQRIYTYVTTKITETWWTFSTAGSKTYSVTVPSSLGVRIV